MAKKKARAKPYQVFVSHATADKWLATTICEKLEGTGATTFRDDRDIKGGDVIPDEIRTQIIQSREMVVLFTPESINRMWVTLEIGAAWGISGIRIIPILCHVKVDTIPDMLKSTKAIHLNDFNNYLDELKTRMRDHDES